MKMIASNIAFLRKKSGVKQSEISDRLGFKRNTWSNWETGTADPDINTLIKICAHFGVDIGDMIQHDLSSVNQTDLHKDTVQPKTERHITMPVLNEPNIAYHTGKMPAVVTVDISGRDNIVYVPIKARAGYLIGYEDPTYIETLPALRLPGLSNGTYRMFEVEGPSMAPTISPSDRVIGEWVENWEHIRDNRVYVIVHKQGIAVKRVINRIKDRGILYLKSDTLAHKNDYPMIEVKPEDILEVWYSRLRLSSDFREPAELYQRMSDVEINTHRIMKHLGLK